MLKNNHTHYEQNSRRVEYLPFGETLVEEHLNSNNSPFRFNAKELDEETGNYYYGARYYDPKFSIWLSVDPLAELMPEWSSYAYTYNSPINYIDPTGMIGEDWYENNKTGKIVWFDETDQNITNEQGEWTNVGKDEQEVKENLNIPEDKHISWNTITGVLLGGTYRSRRRSGAPGLVTINNDAHISFDLNIEGKGGLLGNELIDGKSEITGINISINLTSGTGAPGIQFTNIGGDFGLKNWTPMGKVSTTSSTRFSPLPYPTLSNNETHATGTATMHIPLFQYKGLSRNFSQKPNLNLGIDSTAGYRMQTDSDWNKPTLGTKYFNTSTNFRF